MLLDLSYATCAVLVRPTDMFCVGNAVVQMNAREYDDAGDAEKGTNIGERGIMRVKRDLSHTVTRPRTGRR